jgi:uncharacterized protein (UPF0335 family)
MQKQTKQSNTKSILFYDKIFAFMQRYAKLKSSSILEVPKQYKSCPNNKSVKHKPVKQIINKNKQDKTARVEQKGIQDFLMQALVHV